MFLFKLLQCYSILEHGNLTIAVVLVASFLATRHGDNLVDELAHEVFHLRALYQLTVIEVNPVWLILRQVAVGGNLHRWYEGAEWRATSGGEEYQLASC